MIYDLDLRSRSFLWKNIILIWSKIVFEKMILIWSKIIFKMIFPRSEVMYFVICQRRDRSRQLVLVQLPKKVDFDDNAHKKQLWTLHKNSNYWRNWVKVPRLLANYIAEQQSCNTQLCKKNRVVAMPRQRRQEVCQTAQNCRVMLTVEQARGNFDGMPKKLSS
jgi:hypothetical protein